ncbi:MAG: hypothetical protein WBL68_18460, partial [Nitrososphaeraceae archaeon]
MLADPSSKPARRINQINARRVYSIIKGMVTPFPEKLFIIMSTQNVAGDKVRPGLKSGRSTEFTLILPLKPGGAERMRKKNFGSLPNLGTVHEARWVIFDNDTKLL